MPKVFFYKINRNYQSLHKYWHDIINVRLKLESRNQKRKEFVDAIVIRKEPVVPAARVFSIP